MLKQTPVPWPVFDEARTTELLRKVFLEQAPGGKLKQQLFEIATYHDLPTLADDLANEARFDTARGFRTQRPTLSRKSFVTYFARNFKDILRQCDQHGVDHRLPMNQTPLIAAASAGNVPLVEALIERGADREAADHFGANALHWAMREAFRDAKFARGPFAALYELLAPASVDVNTGERLVRIDRHLSEYCLFQTFWALFATRFTQQQRRPNAAFEADNILTAWEHLPANVVPPNRNKRQHLSGVLARNEIERDYAYNRALFQRVAQGWYQFNPQLSVRRRTGGEENWLPIFQALNLPFLNEFAGDGLGPRIDAYLDAAGLPERTTPIAAERALAELQKKKLRREQKAKELQEKMAARKAQPPAWGTPAARQAEIERIRREIESKRKK